MAPKNKSNLPDNASSMRDTIRNYIRSGKSGLFIQSHEELRVEDDLQSVLAELKNSPEPKDFRLFTWSLTRGLVDNKDNRAFSETQDPVAALSEFDKVGELAVCVAEDMHMMMAEPNPMLFRKLKDTLQLAKTANRVVVIVGCQLRMPPELEKEMAVVEYKLPDRAQLLVVLEGIAKSAKIELNGNTEAILDAASGLTTTEAEDAFALSIIEAKDIVPSIVAREKASTVKKNGILEIVETKASINDIGGLEVLKEWLGKRRLAFSKKAKEFGLPIPKGVLTVGIPGSGKSLTAKAAASILGVPLLKMDAGKLFGSLVGESERNLRTAIQTAEAVAPCVLFVDEIEKGFSGTKSSGSTDGGTSARVFGTFLQWMNDKDKPVFVFATANDITALPPEFLRKGRFDELFFVDMPNEQERADIWALHIAKRGRKSKDFDLAGLSQRSAGFTGAEIEAAVNEALFSAFDADQELSNERLFEAVTNTVPLSKTMAQQIEALRGWAQGRARAASLPTVPVAKTGRKLA